VNILKKPVQLLALIIVVTGAITLTIYLKDIYYKAALSQEKQNSQLLENTCDTVKYNNINCEAYKKLAKELDNFNIPKFTQEDLYCLSTAALSVELPPLTPPVLVELIVSQSMKTDVGNCDIDEVLERVQKNMSEYQKYKTAEKEASNL